MSLFLNAWKFLYIYSAVFKYLAEKYLQKLKQRIVEDPEVVHTSSNKIGTYAARQYCLLIKCNVNYGVPVLFLVHFNESEIKKPLNLPNSCRENVLCVCGYDFYSRMSNYSTNDARACQSLFLKSCALKLCKEWTVQNSLHIGNVWKYIAAINGSQRRCTRDGCFRFVVF